jgi:hypothetical protein
MPPPGVASASCQLALVLGHQGDDQGGMHGELLSLLTCEMRLKVSPH